MPGIVRVNLDSHQGHSGNRLPYHRTYYSSGSPNVFANNEKAVRKGDGCLCGDPATGGSTTVFINNKPAHRQGDATGGHGGYNPNSAASGSTTVVIG